MLIKVMLIKKHVDQIYSTYLVPDITKKLDFVIFVI